MMTLEINLSATKLAQENLGHAFGHQKNFMTRKFMVTSLRLVTSPHVSSFNGSTKRLSSEISLATGGTLPDH